MHKSFPFALALILVITAFTSVIAQNINPEDIALQHLKKNHKTLRLTEDDISNYRISDLYTSKNNGVTHVYFTQQYKNIDVRNAIININILPNGQVLNIGNRFISDLASKANASIPAIAPEDALGVVFDYFRLSGQAYIQLKEKLSDQSFCLRK